MSASASPRNNGVSPSSSPRLPSPPPFTEVQFGPKSPSVTSGVSEFSLDRQPDEGASRRIRPGTKAADMAKGPPFVPLHQLESPFQLQEYLKSLYSKLTRDEASKTVKPVDKEMALQLATPPTAQDTGEVVDKNLWLYELCRLLCNKLTRMIVGFFQDNPPCSAQTCPEMRASEWQYLCAVHDPPKSCCAIDYCNHTLDWASNILSSTKHFPSRLSLGGEGGNAHASMKQITNIFRRVYRIFAHAWFQHREVFWSIEAEHGLYMFFKTVCDEYSLIPEDNYTIPPEAEGEREEKEEMAADPTSPEKSTNVSILQNNNEQKEQPETEPASSQATTGATTRRHKHTPSTGIPIAVIAEGQEEEEEQEETTMLDLGAPGPAQESDSSLSPAKPRIERSKSPGLIEIPKDIDPERAPEDPTPVAVHDSNPFGSPGPAEITGSISNGEGLESTLAGLDPLSSVDAIDSQALEPAGVAAAVVNTADLSAVLDQINSKDDPSTLDNDAETQTVIEASKDEEAHRDSVETIKRTDADEVSKKTADDQTTSSESNAEPDATQEQKTKDEESEHGKSG